MKQGEIWMADLNPVKGSEQQGIRPVVIISGNAMNDNLGVSIICPLKSRIKNFAGCPVIPATPANGLQNDSEVITFQVRSISHSRLLNKTGSVTPGQLKSIKEGLAEILTY